ncbi:MAG TPA: divalent metal cation transporter [Candidatus Saccharimonadales bacterium]|nr:divalent metal cation transporter [Candidatus Saccharimonadales bacterium]
MAKKQKSLLAKTVEAPAMTLAKTVEVSQQVAQTVSRGKGGSALRKTRAYWTMLGPGLTTGASDDDPSGIATYSQAGAQFGYGMVWLAAWTLPLMAFVQEMCARIGIVTGRGLAGNIRVHFPKRVLYACTLFLFIANAFNIGADLGAMAKGVQLLFPHTQFYALVIGFTAFSLLLQIFTPYARYAKYLKWLALILLSYILSAVLAHLNWHEVTRQLAVPRITWSKDYILLLCAILGTTISPYLFFWQTSQEVEEQILRGRTTIRSRRHTEASEVRSMRIDVWSGMLLSNVVMFFIIAACGGILFPHGIHIIQTAAQAAEALRPFAGNATYFLFAVGLIGTGLLAIPVLAGSSSYAISESFRWKEGLYRNLQQAYAFYGIIIISMLVGLGLNFVGIDPIKALIYSAVANGLVAPLILLMIILISSNKKIMGRWVNKPWVSAVGWATFLLMMFAGGATIISLYT